MLAGAVAALQGALAVAESVAALVILTVTILQVVSVIREIIAGFKK